MIDLRVRTQRDDCAHIVSASVCTVFLKKTFLKKTLTSWQFYYQMLVVMDRKICSRNYICSETWKLLFD